MGAGGSEGSGDSVRMPGSEGAGAPRSSARALVQAKSSRTAAKTNTMMNRRIHFVVLPLETASFMVSHASLLSVMGSRRAYHFYMVCLDGPAGGCSGIGTDAGGSKKDKDPFNGAAEGPVVTVPSHRGPSSAYHTSAAGRGYVSGDIGIAVIIIHLDTNLCEGIFFRACNTCEILPEVL